MMPIVAGYRRPLVRFAGDAASSEAETAFREAEGGSAQTNSTAANSTAANSSATNSTGTGDPARPRSRARMGDDPGRRQEP